MFESALIMGRSVLDGMDVPPERAQFVVEDVRKRDMTRLQLQQTQGIFSANEFGYRTPLAPEPLMEPPTEAQHLSEETQRVTEEQK
ncbi:MAG: hypothetical protein AAGE89_17505 [Pseudomonadota bacterium]